MWGGEAGHADAAAIAGALLAYRTGRTRTSSRPTKSPRRWWRTARPQTRTRQRPRASQPRCLATTPSAGGRSPCGQARSHGGSLGPANSRALSGGANKVVAAIGEQILAPTDRKPQQRLQRGPGHAHRGRKCGRLHPDPGGEPWNIVRTYNLTPGRELLFACRYRLGTASNFVVYLSEADNVYDPLYGSFVDQGAWSTAKMYFTVPPNEVAKLHFGARFQAAGLLNQTAGTVTSSLTEGPTTSRWPPWARCCWSHAHYIRKFFGALQQPELRSLGQLHCGRLPAGGLRHDAPSPGTLCAPTLTRQRGLASAT